jgi:hypothetical protein
VEEVVAVFLLLLLLMAVQEYLQRLFLQFHRQTPD